MLVAMGTNVYGAAFYEHWDTLKIVLDKHLKSRMLEFTHHAEERMCEREIPRKVVYSILGANEPSEMFAPKMYPYGENPFQNDDPVFTIVGQWGHEKIAVGLALVQRVYRNKPRLYFRVVTVLKASEHSRHNQ